MNFTASKAITKLIENQKTRTKKLGAKGAKAFVTRLGLLQAADSFEDLRHAPGRFHELKGNRRGQFGWTIAAGNRLIVVSTSEPPPERPDGGIDWGSITEAHLVEIIDYHH